jgi:large subunit ribosomal protein L4e
MFAPNKIWRRWHRRVNVNLKRYATCSALAATALPSLVLARGHKVESLPEVPLVLADEVQSITKTKQAVDVLTNVGAYKDVERAIASRNLRRGKGKMRNRRYVMRKGPLIIYKDDTGLVQAMRNIPGVDLCHIDRLNLLQVSVQLLMGTSGHKY